MRLKAAIRSADDGTTRRSLATASLLVCMLLLAGQARAQGHGGPPGGGGPGGPGGGMMGGGPGGRMDFNRGPSPDRGHVTRTGPQLGLAGRWWDDSKTARKVGLRTEQQRRMDDIFEANKGTLLNLLGNLQQRETQLTSLSPNELQDEAKVFAAIDRVTAARAELEKANAHTMMLIRQQMDSTQVAALDREIAGAR